MIPHTFKMFPGTNGGQSRVATPVTPQRARTRAVQRELVLTHFVDTFYRNGAVETWVARSGITDDGVVVTVVSPPALNQNGAYYDGGLGVKAVGTITDIATGESIEVRVGGYPYAETGGWFDGGDAGTILITDDTLSGDPGTPSGHFWAGGGSGSSDIRRGGSALSDRIIVAGGAGGYAYSLIGGAGLDGGLPDASDDGDPAGAGGTSSGGGPGGTPTIAGNPGADGTLGDGGDGGDGGLDDTHTSPSGTLAGNSTVDLSGNYVSGPRNTHSIVVPRGARLVVTLTSITGNTGTGYIFSCYSGATVVAGGGAFVGSSNSAATWYNGTGADVTIDVKIYSYNDTAPGTPSHNYTFDMLTRIANDPGGGGGGGYYGGGGGAGARDVGYEEYAALALPFPWTWTGNYGGPGGGGSSYIDPSLADTSVLQNDTNNSYVTFEYDAYV